jgi:ComEC/Rec2-related protein
MLSGMADFFIGDVAFAAALGFLAGIFAADLGWNFAAFSVGVILIFPILKYGASLAARMAAVFAAIMLLASFAGIYYFHFFLNWRAAGTRLPDGKSSFQATVDDEPIASEKYLSFSAKLQPPFSGNISVFASPDSNVQYGDLVNISGTVEPPRDAGETSAVFPKNITIISRNNGFWLTEELLHFKVAVNEKFDAFLSQDAAALLGSLTLGGTTGMSGELKNEMTVSETLYVTSMYGYKMAMIVMALEAVLAGFIARRIRFGIEIFVTVFFLLMSGGSISALRGGVMACALIFAKETGRIFSKRNTLALTAVGIALFDPMAIVQAGFLFSFASVAGMALLAKPIRKFLRLGEGKGMLAWRDAVVLSLASLLPIIPLVSAMFGSFSMTAVFANVLIAPAIPLGMIAGTALAAAGFLSPYLGFFVARMAGVVLGYTSWVIGFFAIHPLPLPFSFSNTPSFLVYYAVLVLFAHIYRTPAKLHSGMRAGSHKKTTAP